MEPDPIDLFDRAARGALAVAAHVGPDQLDQPTPCTEWTVSDLLDHMAGGTSYLLGSLGVDHVAPGPDIEAYAAAVDRCLVELRRPGAIERRCASPAGFEWSIGEAAAGTAMDQLVHTWDLAVATGQDTTLDPDLTAACAAIFLPHMPEIGRQAGIVGAEVAVEPGASPQQRLLGAMGRHP